MTLALDVARVGSFYQTHHQGIKMKKLASIILLTSFIAGCQTTSQGGVTIKMSKDENTKWEHYSYIKDPTGSAPSKKVHMFEIGSECGDIKRNNSTKNLLTTQKSTDCEENSARSELSQEGPLTQPKKQWYKWSVYLERDYPIQEGGKLGLGQWHSMECPHVKFSSKGSDNGKLYFALRKTWQGDCKTTHRSYIANLQDMRGKWTEFVIYAEWASDESGVFKLWLDGTQVLDYKGRTLTLGLERYNFLKIGIYQCCNTGLNYQGKTKILPAKAYFTKPIRSSKSLLPK